MPRRRNVAGVHTAAVTPNGAWTMYHHDDGHTGYDPAAPANRKAWEVLNKWEKPFLCAFGDSDPVTKGGDKAFIAAVPGTKGQPHTTIAGGGHFLQEDRGEELAQVIVSWLAK